MYYDKEKLHFFLDVFLLYFTKQFQDLSSKETRWKTDLLYCHYEEVLGSYICSYV